MISVAIVDDHAVVRVGLRRILQEDPELDVVFEAASIRDLLEKIAHGPGAPRVAVLDISLPGASGLDSIGELRRRFPQMAVLSLSVHPEEKYALLALEAGAQGYLNKECAPEQLVEAVRVLADGRRFITPKVAGLLASKFDAPTTCRPHDQLSSRELQIFQMIVKGCPLKAIAASLDINVKTVSTYRTRILQKMKASSNAELVRYALEAGMA